VKSWRIAAVLLLCLVLVGSAACNPFGGDEEEVSQQLVEVVRGDLTVSVSGSGNIEVSDEVRLAFRVSGTVDKVNVEEGDEVNEGKVLVSLDTASLEQAVETGELAVKTAEIDLKVAAKNFEQATDSFRKIIYPYTYSTFIFDVPASVAAISDAQQQLGEAQELFETELTSDQYGEIWLLLKRAQDNLILAKSRLDRGQGADVFVTGTVPITTFWTLRAAQLSMEIAQLQVGKAQLALDKAKNDLDEAGDELEKAVILASFDGIIVSINADEGDTVLTTTTIVHLIDLTSMELSVDVDEIDIPGVKPGQRAIIEIDALIGVQFEGGIISISSLGSEDAGVILYEVKIGFDVPEGSGIKAGMSATADIIISERSNVLLAPSRAIKQESPGNPVVKVMVDEEIEERPVVIGISDDFDTEIVDGLEEGEVVVVERRAR